MARTQFNLISFQDALIARLHDIANNGVGEHRIRSRIRACRNARLALHSRGYTISQADRAVQDAVDMFTLEQLCEIE